MAITMRYCDELPEHAKSPAYHTMAIASGTKTVYLAGQVAWNVPGAPFVDQVVDAYLNVGQVLATAGATFDDIVKLTIFVVGWEQGMIPDLLEGVTRAAAKLGTTATPPVSLIGVASLDVPEHVVEIEATAVI